MKEIIEMIKVNIDFEETRIKNETKIKKQKEEKCLKVWNLLDPEREGLNRKEEKFFDGGRLDSHKTVYTQMVDITTDQVQNLAKRERGKDTYTVVFPWVSKDLVNKLNTPLYHQNKKTTNKGAYITEGYMLGKQFAITQYGRSVHCYYAPCERTLKKAFDLFFKNNFEIYFVTKNWPDSIIMRHYERSFETYLITHVKALNENNLWIYQIHIKK